MTGHARLNELEALETSPSERALDGLEDLDEEIAASLDHAQYPQRRFRLPRRPLQLPFRDVKDQNHNIPKYSRWTPFRDLRTNNV